MPCPIINSTIEYPSYLKNILKEIDVGNDKELKTCACSLKTLTNDEGCILLDEDGKAGLLSECVTVIQEDELANMGYGSNYPFGISQKQLMELYWKYKTININGRYQKPDYCPNPPTVDCNSVGGWERCDRVGLIEPKPKIDVDRIPKQRVCATKQTYSLGRLITIKKGVRYVDHITIELFGGPTRRLEGTSFFFPHINIIIDPVGDNVENASLEECTYPGTVLEDWTGIIRVCTNRWKYSCCHEWGIEAGDSYCDAFCDIHFCGSPCPNCNGIFEIRTIVGDGGNIADPPCFACGVEFNPPYPYMGDVPTALTSSRFCCDEQHNSLSWGIVGGIDPSTKKGQQPARPGADRPAVAKFSFLNDMELVVYIPYYIGQYTLSHS